MLLVIIVDKIAFAIMYSECAVYLNRICVLFKSINLNLEVRQWRNVCLLHLISRGVPLRRLSHMRQKPRVFSL